MRIYFLLFFVFLFSERIKAQEEVWTTFNSSNSILYNIVWYTLADSSGNVWFNSAKFDGSNKYYFKLTMFDNPKWILYDSSYATCKRIPMAVDTSGAVWFGGYNWVSIFDGANWKLLDHTNSELVEYRVNYITIDKYNQKWFGYIASHAYDKGGISVFNDTTWQHYNQYTSGLKDNYVSSIVIDNLDNVWVGCNYNLYFFDGIDWQKSSVAANPEIIDKENKIWFTTEKGVSVYDGLEWIHYDSSNSILNGKYYNDILVDHTNNKWVATWNGVYMFDNDTWKHYVPSNSGLVNKIVYSITEDKDNNLWFGTGGGACRLSFTGTGVNQNNNSYSSKGKNYILLQNYPNPFNSQTKISFSINQGGIVKLTIFNITGQLIKQLVNEHKVPGVFKTVWDGTDNYGRTVSSGIYFYTLTLDDRILETKKLTLLQ